MDRQDSRTSALPFVLEVDDVPEPSTPFKLPTGTVTFLLTDVEGSTRPWQEHPEEMGEVIARHYEILHEAIARWNGVRPVEQGEGDSVVGAFARASDALASLQLLLRRKGERRRTASGWDSLTPAELQVAELVADGLTNPQIAERLIISPATVKTHVSHCLTKLGITNRTELAALALAARQRE